MKFSGILRHMVLADYIMIKCRVNINVIFKYIILIILLQLSHFFSPLSPSALHHPSTSIAPFSSCPWVIHKSSLASLLPILSLTSPCLITNYQLCFLFPVPFPPFSPSPSPLITLHVISTSVILFLVSVFASFVFVF